jgi:hypothetical protein
MTLTALAARSEWLRWMEDNPAVAITPPMAQILGPVVQKI